MKCKVSPLLTQRWLTGEGGCSKLEIHGADRQTHAGDRRTLALHRGTGAQAWPSGLARQAGTPSGAGAAVTSGWIRCSFITLQILGSLRGMSNLLCELQMTQQSLGDMVY